MSFQRLAAPGHRTDAIILCVDDDQPLLEMATHLLEKHGFSVLTATDGMQALEIVREKPVDLVLLDHEMPGMNGQEVAAAIKDMDPGIPVVLHSGASSLSFAALDTTDAFVAKGSGARFLVAAITRLVLVHGHKRMRAN
jgi:CheY-like chemotaxis protein